MTTESRPSEPLKVLVAGGGVAALEAALALRELAGERTRTTLLAPEPEFVYRPMSVREPFGYSRARRYSLEQISRDIGVERVRDSFDWLDAPRRVVRTHGGETLQYDALLLALGARAKPRLKHALTIDDRQLDQQLHGLLEDVEGGHVHSLGFVITSPMPWLLPMYELALMTAQRAYDMNIELSITVLTPEDAPLAIFGTAVSEAVSRLLAERRIRTVTGAYSEMHEPGQLSINPGSRKLRVDRVVALPQLFGPPTPGLPKAAPNGFIPIDAYCKVPLVDRVYAAGDATDFPVKHGGVAAQQADTASEAIAALAGAPVEPKPFHPVIHAVLLGGEQPLYLSAHITGGHGSSSQVGDTPTWSPPSKIAAKYLAPFLDSRDAVGSGAR